MLSLMEIGSSQERWSVGWIFFGTEWACCIYVGAAKEAEQCLMPPGSAATLAMLKSSLGWSTSLVLEGRSGKVRDVKHLLSWILKVISRRDTLVLMPLAALQCWLLLGSASGSGLGLWFRK